MGDRGALRAQDVAEHVDRFMGFVEKQDNGCWYRLSRARDNGYTTISVNRHRIGAHRFAYAAFVGDIPAGMEVDHRCRDRGCVNPSHLELVTRAENVRRRDMVTPGQFAAGDMRERLNSRVDSSGECWLWTGALVRGYGVVSINRRTRYVHRVMYELEHGPIADDMDLDHICRQPRCVNPAHLEPVTRSLNVARMLAAQPRDRCRRGHRYVDVGRATNGSCIACLEASTGRTYVPRRQDTATRCANGHDYAEVGRYPSGGCRQCQADKDAARGRRTSTVIERFCTQGHDLAAVGLRGQQCQTCWDEGWCVNGHDMNATGRTPQGACLACKQVVNRTYAQSRAGSCANGHDLALVGVNPSNGQCRECAREYVRVRTGATRTRADLDAACRNGHPWSEENTRYTLRSRNGAQSMERVCRECARERSRKYDAKRSIHTDG